MLSIDTLYDSLAASVSEASAHTQKLVTRAEELIKNQAPINPEYNNEELRETFAAQSGLHALAVVENDVPIGLINRNIFLEQYSRPYGREVYGRKSCIAFMDKEPLVVDSQMPIETLVKHAVESGGKVLADGFIATRDGQYLGLGSGYDLLKAMSDIEAEKTRQLMSSITYASLIQQSHLVESDDVLASAFASHGKLWVPRDVVGGDAYFFRKVGDGVFGCVFDCTGHGVPGAFMTLIVLSFLEQQVAPEAKNIDPGMLMSALNRYLKRVLRQDDRPSSEQGEGDKVSNDGLDAVMFVIGQDGSQMRYASAKLSILVLHPAHNEVHIAEGSKLPVGYSDTPSDSTWQTETLSLSAQSLLVFPTDGVIDQIGQVKRIAHGKKRLIQFAQDNAQLNAQEFAEHFGKSFEDWQGSERRRDDVTLLVLQTR